MKCPKCGYHSFEHLDSCKKCNVDLTEHKAKFSLRGFFAPGQSESALPVDADLPGQDELAEEGEVDFGFDFLEEDEEPAAQTDRPAKTEPGPDLAEEPESLGREDEDLNLDQPFGVDGESVPADQPDKKGPGSEFSF